MFLLLFYCVAMRKIGQFYFFTLQKKRQELRGEKKDS